MKDLPPRPQPPLPLLALPRELRLVQVEDELREVPDGDRRPVARARGVRRRLFADDDSAGADEEAGGSADAGRRRRRPLWPGARLEEPAGSYLARRVQESLDKLLAQETAAASRRWNFDFENERPLEGQWQWEKVEDLAGSASDENGEGDGDGDGEQVGPADDCHSPQR